MKSLLLLLCLSLCLFAQDKPAPPPGAEMPKPSPEMQKLVQTFRGIWVTAEKHEPAPWLPSGGAGKGQARFISGPGDLSLIENYRSTTGPGRFVAHGITWWDSDKHTYAGVWCDNTTPQGCEAGGTMKWDGDKLVGSMNTSMSGQKARITETYSNITPDSFTYAMDASIEGSMVKRIMTIEFRRAGAPAKPAGEEKKQ